MAHWATEAYFKHGGEPHFIFPTTLGPNGAGPSPLSSFQQQTSSPFHPPVQTPPLSMGGALGRPMIGPEVQLSGKHDGLILYLSRLLRPLWNVAVAMETQVAGSSKVIKILMCTRGRVGTIDKKKNRGRPGLNRGPLDLQSNALPLSYTPSCCTIGMCNVFYCQQVLSHYDTQHLSILGEQLRELKSFLDANIQFFTADDIKNQR